MAADLLAETGGFTVGVHNLPYCSFDFCAVVLNLIVLINYAVSKKINNRTAKLFYTLSACSLCASVFNLLGVLQSVFFIPAVLCGIFHLLNSFFYNAAGVVFFIYVVNLVSGGRTDPLWRAVACALGALMAAGLILSALDIFGAVAVSERIYDSVMYFGQLAATVCALSLIIINRSELRFLQRLNVYLFSAINGFAYIWQMLITFGVIGQRIQISSFALSIAVLLVYVTLQRPEDEIDPVTGMFNVRTHTYRTNERLRSGKPFVAFVFEISNMAMVNATFGINGGNRVLKEIAERVRAVLPAHLFLFRLNGARFGVNFNGASEYKEFEPAFLKAFDKPVEVGGTKIIVASMGCLVDMPSVTDKVSDLEELLRYYRSVAKASDKVLVADTEALERSRRRERVEYAIQKALKNRGFDVYYQPIYSVARKRITSCEALIRLKDDELGFIGPDEFIPVAEETGRIVEIGRFVMEEVCGFIRTYRPEEYGIEFIDVNLSVIQCMHPEIIEDINSVLNEYGVPRRMVNLEVTETASAKSYALLQSRLSELHSNGFTISLDDFGSGFSSVEYLINFPFDIVKLDKSLVWAYMSTEKYEPILKHYMPMLHGLGLKIVAEGVETKEMLDSLEELGCDYIQGYYFSRPLPKEEFLGYIKKAAKGELIA